jgi:TPR repeat protein
VTSVQASPAAPRRRSRLVAAWTLALLCGGAAYGLAQIGHARVPRSHPLEELSYYPSGLYVKPAALGHPETAADLAWIRAVQYYGDHRQTDNRFVRMHHVFDILTTLAPGFIPAYVFGAFAMAQEGRDFASAERLMAKGLEANPTSGELAFELGFLYYIRPGGRDLEQAAQYFEQATHQRDGPPQASRFAAFARQHSGNLQVAYELWAHVERTSANSALREIAEREMRRIRRAIEAGKVELAVKRLATPTVELVPESR